MSGPPYQQRPPGPLFNNPQGDRLPGSIGSPQSLAQFTAAAASSYHPRPQVKQTTNPSIPSTAVTTTDASQQAKPKSDFAASFYAAGDNAAKLSHIVPPPAQPVDASFKGLKFITLDPLQLETREIYDKISGTYQWEMCETQDDRCVKFIREECVDKRAFIISSGGLGQKIVPEIHNLPQVYAIYIYCGDVQRHQAWANNFPKVRVVCNDDDRVLLPQLAVDVAQANLEWGVELMKQNKRDLAKKKFEKASENLTLDIYAKTNGRSPEPSLVSQVNAKLQECK